MSRNADEKILENNLGSTKQSRSPPKLNTFFFSATPTPAENFTNKPVGDVISAALYTWRCPLVNRLTANLKFRANFEESTGGGSKIEDQCLVDTVLMFHRAKMS